MKKTPKNPKNSTSTYLIKENMVVVPTQPYEFEMTGDCAFNPNPASEERTAPKAPRFRGAK